MRPRLKGVVWERVGAELRLVYDVRDQLLLHDPDKNVEALLFFLAEGGRTPAELAATLALPENEVCAAVEVLNVEGLLEDGDRLGQFDPAQNERYFSNLAFFESFATLQTSREDMQRRLRDAHVLVLGAGGLNSNTVPHLCGLGVGRLTVLDRDRVEARNFARQYLYRWDDRGEPKAPKAAEWVRQFDPTIQIQSIDAEITGPDELTKLIGDLRPDVVASGVDHPLEIDFWVNQACVRHGVPLVRGGMSVTTGMVWSVDPGRSACRVCMSTADDPGALIEAGGGGTAPGDTTASAVDEAHAVRLFQTKPRTNRGIGPVAGLLGALGAFEVLRFITGFEPPAYAGRPLQIDFAAGCAMRQTSWERNPDCAVCG